LLVNLQTGKLTPPPLLGDSPDFFYAVELGTVGNIHDCGDAVVLAELLDHIRGMDAGVVPEDAQVSSVLALL
jgi:hypothetical protein